MNVLKMRSGMIARNGVFLYSFHSLIDTQKFLAGIADVCSREPAVRVAYLHGSQAAGGVHEGSDVDIAVLLDSSLSPDKQHDIHLWLYGECARLPGIDEDRLDVTLLNAASLLLRYNVFLGGIRAFEADRTERLRYEAAVWRDFDDQEYALRERIAFKLHQIANS